MSFLAALCGCFTRSDVSPQTSSKPEMQTTVSYTRSGVQTGSFILNDEGEFVRADGPPGGRSGHGPPPSDSDTIGGYASVVPLPQYTPRPMSIHEKTLEAHLRDPPMSSDSSIYQDEKRRHMYDEEVTSDSSSTISYPSSYGNTSTATRETPPPPYSPRHSVMLSRSRATSISSAMAVTINPPPMARLNGARTGPPPPMLTIDLFGVTGELHGRAVNQAQLDLALNPLFAVIFGGPSPSHAYPQHWAWDPR